MRSRLTNPAAVVLILLTAWTTDAHAVDMEFYTYGGFDAVKTAFDIVAVIFGNNEYIWMFAGAAALGLFAALITSVFGLIAGERTSFMAFLLMWLLGVTIYLGFVVPKGNIVLYDPVKNRNATVGGIPDGVVFVAGMMNLVERGVVDIINTTSPPIGFAENAGGVGFDMLLGLDSGGVVLADSYLQASLSRYIKDCVFFEMTRPGTALTMASVNSNTDFMTVFSNAQNPAIYTVYYSTGHPEGESRTCTDAYTALSAAIGAAGTYSAAINERCASAGFDPTVAAELARCQSALVDPINWFQGATYSVTQVFRQTHLARSLADALTSSSPDTAIALTASRASGSSMLAAGVASTQYIPIIKAILTAVAVCMVPVMALFIPTPLFKSAISFMVGLFLLVTLWGVIDAILHSFVVNYAKKAFYEVSSYGLGFQAIMNFGTASMKSLAAVAGIRWTGLMIAMAISSALIKTGGNYAMTRVAGGMTGVTQQAGTQAGNMIRPEGGSRAINEMSHSPGVWANADKHSFQERADAHTMDQMTQTGTGLGNIRHEGGGNVAAAADRVAGANVTDTARRVGHGEGIGGPGYSGWRGSQQGQQERGAMFQDDRMADAMGISQSELGEFRSHGVITDKMAPSVGKTLGLNTDQSKQLLSGMKVNPNALSVNQQTGELNLTSGEHQDQRRLRSIGNGMVMESGTMNAVQLLDKSQDLKRHGHTEAAQALRKLVNPNVTSSDGQIHGMAGKNRGLLANETAAFMEKKSFDGKMAEVGYSHGSDVKWFDTSSDRQGRDERLGDHIDRADRTTEVNDGQVVTSIGDPNTNETAWKTGESTKGGVKTHSVYDADNPDKVAYQEKAFVEDGAMHNAVTNGAGRVVTDSARRGSELNVSEGSFYKGAAQMAMDGNPMLVSQISKPGLSSAERDTERLQVAGSVAGEMQSLIQRTGDSKDYSQTEGSTGVAIPKNPIFNAGASSSKGYQTTDAYNVNLGAQRYNDVLKQAEKEASRKNVAKEDTDKYLAQSLQAAVKEDVAYFEKHGAWSYGALGVENRVKESLKPTMNGPDLSKGGIDGIKG